MRGCGKVNLRGTTRCWGPLGITASRWNKPGFDIKIKGVIRVYIAKLTKTLRAALDWWCDAKENESD